MVKDPLSDFLIRIKNAEAVKKELVVLPYSKLLWEVAKLLEREGYLTKLEKRGKRMRRSIEASVVYGADGERRFSGARRISKSSRRLYKKASELHRVKHGYGFEIISTSKGLMTNKEARKANMGGEVLFEI